MSLRFSADHEWIRVDNDHATIGITDFAQGQLGDVVFVELPAVGANVARGDSVGVVESVKAASSIYSPLSGEIVEVNTQLLNKPELINDAPASSGWMFRVRMSASDELGALMSPEAYAAHIA